MGLFGPSKAERASAAAEQTRLERERADEAAREAARDAEMHDRMMKDSPLQAADKKLFQAAFRQWLDAMSDYQLSTHASNLTDELVTREKVMPLPSTSGLSRMGSVSHLAEMRTWSNLWANEYRVNAVVAKGDGAISFWQDVTEYVEGALLQPGL